MTQDEINRQDELIEIKLPRSEAETLRALIKERQTYNFLIMKIKNWWVFSLAVGALGLIAFGEKLQTLFLGAPK